ncbi:MULTISPECIES: serine/threonine protein kinase [unclassified Schlesneria]|uniref:serine/threonine protein kinase n=1 Tax=Schlesneria TaxID=656899 RepID=UPI002F1D3739
MEPQWIWPFELLDKLGEGGMGVVYRARYVGNNRQVAVKLIPNDITANATVFARFERELDVLKQLSHPNIVHCFGGSCESKQRFYAMEYVPGGTLSDYLLEKGALGWENAVDYAIQMCDALQYAHEKGVTHRDVKPANFLMTKSGQLKLSDFGLASIVSQGRLTASGRTVGTILYMSPEQIRGGPVTNRVDLYGLGCVIFEMLSGRTPYSGETAAEVMQRHLKDPVPHVAAIVLNCPLELDQLVCELLAKDPAQRPATAAEVNRRLHEILLPGRKMVAVEPSLFGSGKQPPVKMIKAKSSPASSKRAVAPEATVSSRIPWGIAGVASLMCLFLAYGWMQSARQLRQAEQNWVSLLDHGEPGVRVVAASSLAKFPSLSPDTISRLSDCASLPHIDLQLASLRTLSAHASQSRSLAAELLRIQKSDESSAVRAEAATVLTAIQQSSRPFSYFFFALEGIIVLSLIGAGFGGWWIWNKFKAFAN